MGRREKDTSQISNIEAAILGLLREGSRYGYEIEKLIEERAMRYWTEIGFSSIYYVLKRLERKGLVHSDVRAGEAGKPARKIYGLTPTGGEAMRSKVKNLLSAYCRVVSPFDLGISFSGVLSKEEVRSCLTEYLASLDKRLEQTDERSRRWKKSDSPVAPLAVIRFDRHMALVRAEKSWMKSFLKKGCQ
jgi:DNA-binding PadR family transcriptional regulator